MDYEDPIRTEPFRVIRNRLFWLIIGLLGTLIAALVVRSFEAVLRRDLALVFFIPAIVYMADAAGTQTETIFIRGLSQGWLHKKRFLLREIFIGTLIGLFIGSISFLLIAIWLGDFRIATAVAVSMAVTIPFAMILATIIPWIFWKLKRDPALGSGPFATIFEDVLSLFIYFVIASAILFGGFF